MDIFLEILDAYDMRIIDLFNSVCGWFAVILSLTGHLLMKRIWFFAGGILWFYWSIYIYEWETIFFYGIMLVFHIRAFFKDYYKIEHSDDEMFAALIKTRQENELLAADLAQQAALLDERRELLKLIDQLPLKHDLTRKTADVIRLMNDNDDADNAAIKTTVTNIVRKLDALSQDVPTPEQSPNIVDHKNIFDGKEAPKDGEIVEVGGQRFRVIDASKKPVRPPTYDPRLQQM